MPIISIFFGIIVRVFHDDHPPPHFHVEYGEHTAVVDLSTGMILAGKLPPRVVRLVQEWRKPNVARLRGCWTAAQSGKQPTRIRPLK